MSNQKGFFGDTEAANKAMWLRITGCNRLNN